MGRGVTGNPEVAAVKTAGLSREEILTRIEDFHGHLGPYVILGFRAGQLALRSLGVVGYFDLEARVWSGTKPPLSCFADGVQLGSGCTTGKGNLTVEAGEAGLAARVEFRTRPRGGPGSPPAPVPARPAPTEPAANAAPASTEPGIAPAFHASTSPGGARLRLTVRPEVAAQAGKWLAELGDRGSARRLLEMSDAALFEISEETGPATGPKAGSTTDPPTHLETGSEA